MIKVWDPLLRLLHWSLVASIAIAWLTGEDGEALHEWAGYAALGLIAFRLVWGGLARVTPVSPSSFVARQR